MRMTPIFYAYGESARFSLSDVSKFSSVVAQSDTTLFSRLKEITGFEFGNGSSSEKRSLLIKEGKSRLDLCLHADLGFSLDHIQRSKILTSGLPFTGFLIFGRYYERDDSFKQIIIAENKSNRTQFNVIFDSGIDTSDLCEDIPELTLLVAFKQEEIKRNIPLAPAAQPCNPNYVFHPSLGMLYLGSSPDNGCSFEDNWNPQIEEVVSDSWFQYHNRQDEKSGSGRSLIFRQDPLVSFMLKNPHRREMHITIERMCKKKSKDETALFLLETSLKTGIPASGIQNALIKDLPMQFILEKKKLVELIFLAKDKKNKFNPTSNLFALKLLRHYISNNTGLQQINRAVSFEWVDNNRYHPFAMPFHALDKKAEFIMFARDLEKEVGKKEPLGTKQVQNTPVPEPESVSVTPSEQLYSDEWARKVLEILTSEKIENGELVKCIDDAMAFDPKSTSNSHSSEVNDVILAVGESPDIVNKVLALLDTRQDLVDFLMHNSKQEPKDRHPFAYALLRNEPIIDFVYK